MSWLAIYLMHNQNQEKHRKIIEGLIERQQEIYNLVEERTNKNTYTTYVEA